jgi:hypothetical protein
MWIIHSYSGSWTWISKILYDNYAGMFATFDDFCQVMNQCTNTECLVIDNTSSSNSSPIKFSGTRLHRNQISKV